MIAYGFVLEKYTYLRDGWNVIDFAVVVTRFIKIIIKIAYFRSFQMSICPPLGPSEFSGRCAVSMRLKT